MREAKESTDQFSGGHQEMRSRGLARKEAINDRKKMEKGCNGAC